MSGARLPLRTRILDLAWRVGLNVAYRGLLVWWFLRRGRGRGVYVAVWHAGRLLLIKNSYKRAYTLPCGSTHRGEALAVGAARELGEEVGILVEPSQLAPFAEIVSHHEFREDHCHFFELVLEREPEVEIDRREVVWAGFRSPEAARVLLLWPPVRLYLDRCGHRPAAGAD